MILLQAAIAAGIILVAFVGFLVIVAIPVLTILIMKMMKKNNESGYIKNISPETAQTSKSKSEFNWGILISSIALSIFIIAIFFVLSIAILDAIFPSIE